MADDDTEQVAPEGTTDNGRELWDWLTGFDPEPHEVAIIREAVRTVDLLESLAATVRGEGVVIDSPQGRKAHPAAVEARAQRIALARLIAALRVPEDDAGVVPSRRAQRRYGARGIYAIAGGAE